MADTKSLLDGIFGGDAAGTLSSTLESMRSALKSGTESAHSALKSGADQAQQKLEGTSAGEMFGQARKFAEENTAATLAAAGGLAALLLGTGAGRRVAGGAARVGGLAALGGLAYKAYSNWQAGKPALEGVPGLASLTAAPEGSGFGAAAVDDGTARIVLKAMIGAAAADGVIDPAETARIEGQAQKSGATPETAAFIQAAVAKPPTPAEVAAEVGGNQKLAAEVYAAATLMVEPDNVRERAWVVALASALALPKELVDNIDGAVASAVRAA
jgi:uncharacterized membrane protein YebE (DUF533 family)